MSENQLDITRYDTTHVEKCKSLKEIRNALKALNVYDKVFTHFTGLADLIIDEHTSLLFLSSKPTNQESVEWLPAGCTGKILAMFLFQEYANPSVTLYHLTPNARLGGWELMAQVVGDDFYLRADRVLLGSRSKAN